MLRPNAWRVACAVGLLAGCESESPSPRLTAVQPARAHTDRPVRLELWGSDLVPAWHIDLGRARRTGDAAGFTGELRSPQLGVAAALVDFGWGSTGQLSATLPPGLPAGRYRVSIRDPRGAPADLDNAFESLGEDRDPPVIVFEQPGPSPATAPGARLRVRVSVHDGTALTDVRWQLRHGQPLQEGRCPVAQGVASLSCSFEASFPITLAPGAELELSIEASDGAEPPNVGRAARPLVLGVLPTLLSVSPARGATSGGTEVVVRGSRLLPGSRVYFGRTLLQPGGGVRIDDQTITGRTPAHAEGGALVRVETPLGDAQPAEGQTLFEFAPPPSLRALDPAQLSPAGGTPVLVTGDHFSAETRLLQGPSLQAAALLRDQVVLNAREIRATSLPTPAGVRISLFAVDPLTGWGALPQPLAMGAP